MTVKKLVELLKRIYRKMFNIRIRDKHGNIITDIGDVTVFNKEIHLQRGQSVVIDISKENGDFVFTSLRDIDAGDFWSERVEVSGSVVKITAVTNNLIVHKGKF